MIPIDYTYTDSFANIDIDVEFFDSLVGNAVLPRLATFLVNTDLEDDDENIIYISIDYFL